MIEFSLQSWVLDFPVRFDHPRAARRVLEVTRGRAGRPIAVLPCFDVSSSTLNGVNGLISFSAGGGVGTSMFVLRCTSRRTVWSWRDIANGLLGTSVKTWMGDERLLSGDAVDRMCLRGYGDALDDVRDRTR